MAELYEKYNVDNVFNRTVIAGLLYLLNNKIKYEQVWDDNVVETVDVPFAYDFGSSEERFAQDNYTFFGRRCFSDKMIDGKFDMLPRFAIKYTGSQIDSANITNRFVQGEHMKDENGVLTSYVSYLYSIPLTFNFECEGWIDNLDTAFKIEQSLRETFYKNRTFFILYRGMKVGCCAGFPESNTLEKTTTYSFDNERQLKLNFNLAVETYQPCFDDSTEISASNKIEYFGFDVNEYTDGAGPMSKRVNVKFDMEPITSMVAGCTYTLKWTSTSNVSDVCTVSLYYMKNGERFQIAAPFFNKGFYDWTVPEELIGIKQPDIVMTSTDDISIEELPEFRVVPDANGYVTKNSITIINGGKFSKGGTIPFTIEFVNSKSEVKIYTYKAKVEMVNGEFTVTKITEGSKFIYMKPDENSTIDLYIEYPIDTTIYDKISNILII